MGERGRNTPSSRKSRCRAHRARAVIRSRAVSESPRPSIRYRRHPQTAGRIVDGLAFVVTADDSKLHTLNGTATRMWQLAAQGCTADEIADDLTARYEVDRDTARRDAERCLRDLVTRRILIAE